MIYPWPLWCRAAFHQIRSWHCQLHCMLKTWTSQMTVSISTMQDVPPNLFSSNQSERQKLPMPVPFYHFRCSHILSLLLSNTCHLDYTLAFTLSFPCTEEYKKKNNMKGTKPSRSREQMRVWGRWNKAKHVLFVLPTAARPWRPGRMT